MRAVATATALDVHEEAFARARAHARKVESMLCGDDMMRKQHSELEALLAGAGTEWARLMLERQFDNLIFDNGPHSFTRVVLRKRLYDMAKGQDKDKREGSIRALRFMKEQGVLLALRDEAGDAGKLARDAYHELMNPKIVTGVKIPEIESAKSE